jgi:hypothetical protein
VNEQQIADLLERADAGAVVPAETGPGLAERAIGRARRRCVVRRVGLAVLAVDAVAAVVFAAVWLAPTDPPVTTPATVVSATHGAGNELAVLRARVSAQQAIVDALLAMEHRADEPPTETADPLAEIHTRVELAAKRMVLTADRLEHDQARPDSAQRLYREVVDSFPDTAWAVIARRRLDARHNLNEPRSAL